MTLILRGLAVVFAVGAVIAAIVGYRLSTKSSQPPVVPTESVVQAVRPLRAGEPIGADAVALHSVPSRPEGSFAAVSQVVGQVPMVDIPVGQPITRGHFPPEGKLLHGLRAGERAVAIKVDEVVGLGGFAQPGDRVDVLYYLRGSQETGNATSAQVVLADVRLLAYGESMEQAADDANGRTRSSAAATAGHPRTTTSAVLAVPESTASRLMLAANSGTLRLALRPPEGAATGGQANLVRLADLAQAVRPAPEKRPARGGAREVVVLHEGDAIRTVGVPSP